MKNLKMILMFLFLSISICKADNWKFYPNSKFGVYENDYISTINKDSSNTFWIGTDHGNVIIMMDTNFIIIKRDDSRNNPSQDERKAVAGESLNEI